MLACQSCVKLCLTNQRKGHDRMASRTSPLLTISSFFFLSLSLSFLLFVVWAWICSGQCTRLFTPAVFLETQGKHLKKLPKGERCQTFQSCLLDEPEVFWCLANNRLLEHWFPSLQAKIGFSRKHCQNKVQCVKRIWDGIPSTNLRFLTDPGKANCGVNLDVSFGFDCMQNPNVCVSVPEVHENTWGCGAFNGKSMVTPCMDFLAFKSPLSVSNINSSFSFPVKYERRMTLPAPCKKTFLECWASKYFVCFWGTAYPHSWRAQLLKQASRDHRAQLPQLAWTISV